ncbi:hypothetical protein SDRG_01470 [Saprolegnia diclina VS20]|uniref:FYVE-type domain-containing protein n=1 Tax=Saprolegnia diclina (strain VS20) TaxID=1156394 RepID=T0S8D2_SAPDV|nr:hypothetical protein SDRG_01470 [Saprolegnia diclina VS20]EQC41503.1 hypothetical protein SDRG_01470 [Saprolegnia diclina VS20]|eukprot:XP_008605217.1 hypothetical protein SDRG_01470 [Saprolegnia diclina VS20]
MVADPFQCPPLSRCERDRLMEKAHTACKLTVRNACAFAARYTLDSELHNDRTGRHATIHKGVDVDGDVPEAAMCARTHVRASLEEVANFFVLDTPAKCDAYSRVTGHLVQDKQSLYTLVAREAGLHFIGVNWMVAKTPIGLKARDFCYLEVHDEFTFIDRATQRVRRGWVRCMHSIPLPCCPSLEKSHGYVRSQFVRSGHIVLETARPGVLEYFNLLCGVTRRLGFTPVLAQDFVLRRHVSQILNLEEHFITQRLKTLLETPTTSFPNKDTIEYCSVCYHKFAWLSVKRQCRGCGDVLCTRCCAKWDVPLSETVISMMACQRCTRDGHSRDSSLPVSPVHSRFRLDAEDDEVEPRGPSDSDDALSPLGLHHMTFKGEEDDLALAAVSPFEWTLPSPQLLHL